MIDYLKYKDLINKHESMLGISFTALSKLASEF